MPPHRLHHVQRFSTTGTVARACASGNAQNICELLNFSQHTSWFIYVRGNYIKIHNYGNPFSMIYVLTGLNICRCIALEFSKLLFHFVWLLSTRSLHYALLTKQSIIRGTKSRKMRWAKHAATGVENTKAYIVLVDKPKAKRLAGRGRHG
jgi:hypothetical protein